MAFVYQDCQFTVLKSKSIYLEEQFIDFSTFQ